MENTKQDRLKLAIEQGLPYAFISSLVYEFRDFSSSKLRNMRSEIYQFNFEADSSLLPAYVDEVFNEGGNQAESSKIVDRLIQYVRNSELLILLLVNTDRVIDHGSPLKNSFLYTSPVSFWEMEIFAAAVLEKPIFIVAEEDFRPGTYFSQVLQLFAKALPREISYCKKEKMPELVRGILEKKQMPEGGASGFLRDLVNGLDEQRYIYKNIWDVELNLTSIRFFERDGKPDLDFIKSSLDELAVENYEMILTRLYPIYRELLKADYTRDEYIEFLPYWNIVISKWSSAARWYGLHSRISLGALSTIQDLIIIRDRIREKKLKDIDPAMQQRPAGDLASEHYSLYSMSGNLAHLNHALNLLENSQQAGSLSIRAHCYLQLGDYPKAIALFEQLRSEKELDPDITADELLSINSSLGFAYFLSGSFEPGLTLMRNAYENYKVDCGDKVRVIRRLAFASRLLGDFTASDLLLYEGIRIAKAVGAFDQMSKVQKDLRLGKQG